MNQTQEQAGRLVRQAWIDGVRQYYPGEPKEGYTADWENMPQWEQEAVQTLYGHVRNIIEPTLNAGITISREHGGYLVASIWNILMFQLLKTPKPSYIKHFNELAEWQQKTDILMFEAIEKITIAAR